MSMQPGVPRPTRLPRPRRLAVLGLAAALLGCGEEAAPPEAVVRPVKMLEVGGVGSGSTREYPGTIAAAQHAELGFEVPGRIVELPVREGQAVEDGTILAKLDPRDYQARLDSAQADLNNARTNYERSQKLFAEGVLAEAERDRRKAAYEMAEAGSREARKAVEDTVLRAPFSGRVARRLVDDFQNVQAKQPVLILQDDSSLEIKVAIPERDVRGPVRTEPEALRAREAELRPRVIVSSIPDREFPARVKEFATTADPVTRTFQVTLTFARPEDVAVLPGMTAKAVVETPASQGDALRIPASAALADENGAAYVWRVDPGAMTVRRAPVELGELAGSEVEVRSGLAAGDLVVVSGVHQLREGMRVRRLGN